MQRTQQNEGTFKLHFPFSNTLHLYGIQIWEIIVFKLIYRQNVASPLEASLPANIPCGPAGEKKELFRLPNNILECLKGKSQIKEASWLVFLNSLNFKTFTDTRWDNEKKFLGSLPFDQKLFIEMKTVGVPIVVQSLLPPQVSIRMRVQSVAFSVG